MKILVVEPERVPYEKEISGGLESMQEIVGGNIEAAYPFKEEVCIVCNEMGVIQRLPLNRKINEHMTIAGTFFICGLGDENFASLTDDQVNRYEKRFEKPEIFLLGPYNQLVARKVEPSRNDPHRKDIRKSPRPKVSEQSL